MFFVISKGSYACAKSCISKVAKAGILYRGEKLRRKAGKSGKAGKGK